MSLERITTQRLLLIPFTRSLATSILEGNYDDIQQMGLGRGEGWPDQDAIETIPKILAKLGEKPTGFESWMIIKKDGMTIIGDTGFKGRPNSAGEVDIGYGIIEKERKQGYGVEAAKGLADWAFSQPEVNVITAKCLIDNARSANILVKLGFEETSRDEDMIHWQLQKPKG